MQQLDLSNFHGTTQWYRFSPLTKAVLTDGTKYVAEQTNNFGLMQDIGIDLCLHEKISKQINSGKLIIIDIDTNGKGLEYKNGYEKIIHSYPLIGYESLKIRLFSSLLSKEIPCIYLPSEY